MSKSIMDKESLQMYEKEFNNLTTDIHRIEKIRYDKCYECQYSPMCYIQNGFSYDRIMVVGDMKIIEIPCRFFKKL